MANTDAAIVAGALALVLAAGITVAVQGNPDTDSTSSAPSAAPPAPSSPAVPAPTTPVATAVVPTVAVAAPTPVVPVPTPSPSPQVTVTVTPAPATSAYTSTLTIVYTVKPGDNLSIIAGWFHTHGYGAIYAANRSVIGRDPALIHPGQRIKIVGGTPTTTP